MSLFNNFRMVFKVGLIALLMGGAMIGLVSYMGSRMSAVDEAYSDVIKRVDTSSISISTTARRAESYREAAFELLTETTDAGNERLLKVTQDASAEVLKSLKQIKADLPERATEVGQRFDEFSKAFTACKPAVEYASTTTTPEDNAKAAGRMRAECNGILQETIASQLKFVDDMVAFSKLKADEQHHNAVAEIRAILVFAVVVSAATTGLALVLGIFGITKPLGNLVVLLRKLANDDFSAEILGAERKDEIGDIVQTAVVFKNNGMAKLRMEQEQKEAEKRVIEQRKIDIIKMANDFEGAVGEIIETVSSASIELEASAGTLTATADRAQEVTTMIAAASEEASTNVNAVANATRELTSSVNDIGRQVQESARIANEAVDQSRHTTDRVSKLSQAAARIGDVVELINKIAGQTNLLALNATIEAARAGENGRGFAVVASEVKALAEQTAKATSEIWQQINDIQAATHDSVNAIKEISETIEKLSKISADISAALEEQGTATRQISNNVQQAAEGTQQVSSNIVDVQRGASETGSASSQVLSAAQSLSRDSARLKLEFGTFLDAVRVA